MRKAGSGVNEATFAPSPLLSSWTAELYPSHPMSMGMMLGDILEDMARTEAVDFFDVGAHVGFYACHVGVNCPQATPHAFDLNPACCVEIARNLFENHIQGRVICAAVAEEAGQIRRMRLFREGKPATMKSIQNHEPTMVPFVAPTVSLWTYAVQAGIMPKVFKIDVERDEERVIYGMKHLFRFNDPMAVYVEIHPRGDGQMIHRIVDFMHHHGFAPARYEVEGGDHFRFRR